LVNVFEWKSALESDDRSKMKCVAIHTICELIYFPILILWAYWFEWVDEVLAILFLMLNGLVILRLNRTS